MFDELMKFLRTKVLLVISYQNQFIAEEKKLGYLHPKKETVHSVALYRACILVRPIDWSYTSLRHILVLFLVGMTLSNVLFVMHVLLHWLSQKKCNYILMLCSIML